MTANSGAASAARIRIAQRDERRREDRMIRMSRVQDQLMVMQRDVEEQYVTE